MSRTDAESKHSRLPWRVVREGKRSHIRCPSAFHAQIEASPDLDDLANQEFIVRAVNSHDALVEAAVPFANGPADPQAGMEYSIRILGEEIIALRKALALAKGSSEPSKQEAP